MKEIKAVWRKVGRSLRPASREADDILLAHKEGSELIGDVHGARNPRQLKLYWVLCAILVDHDVFYTKDAASNAIKIATGHVQTMAFPDTGEVYLVPRSIAFASMAQADFSEFMDAAINVIVSRWLQGTDGEDLRREVYAVLDGPAAIGERAA
jgi:hypothetical protein